MMTAKKRGPVADGDCQRAQWRLRHRYIRAVKMAAAARGFNIPEFVETILDTAVAKELAEVDALDSRAAS